MWQLTKDFNNNDKKLYIRNGGDYRVVLDCILVLNDSSLTDIEKLNCCLLIFYENYQDITDFEKAISDMYSFISYNDENENKNSPKLMDWEQDFKLIVSPISRVIGTEVRSLNYLHWWSFLSAYMEIGDCLFNQVVAIRSKKKSGKKLTKEEEKFYRDNYKMVKLKEKLTLEEEDWLNFRK